MSRFYRYRPSNKISIFVLLIVLLALNLVLGACSDQTRPAPGLSPSPSASGNSNPKTIRIYTSLSLNSDAKNSSQSLINAMQMALDDATKKTNEVAGFHIDFEVMDNSSSTTSGSDPAKESANAQKAAADPDAMFYLGPTGTTSAQAAIPILNQAGITMISPGTTYPGLTKGVKDVTKSSEPGQYYPTGTRNFFRLLPTDELQGRADAAFTEQKLQAEAIYVVDDGTDYGKGLAAVYKQSAGEFDFRVIGQSSLVSGQSDFGAVVDKIKQAKPKLIFYAGNGKQAGQLASQVRLANIEAKILGGGGIQNDTYIKEAGLAGLGTYSSISGTDSAGLSPKGTAFVQEYKARYGDSLQATTLYGYDAMSVALSIIKTVGQKDRAALLKATAALKNFDGVSGTFGFDQNGDTTYTVFAFFVNENRQWAFDSMVDTSTNPQKPSVPVAAVNGTATVGAPISPQSTASPDKATTPPATTKSVGPPVTTPPIGQRRDAASQLQPGLVQYKLGGLPVAVYLPPDAAQKSEPTEILFALHGMFGNGGDFAANLLPFAEKHSIALLAPTFNYNVNYKTPEILTNEDVQLTARLNDVVTELSNVTGVKFEQKAMLFGFSRGAQLSHHYAMLYPSRVRSVVVLSGGAYTLPETTLNGQVLPMPFGVGDLERYTDSPFDQTSFSQIAFRVQVGAMDNDPGQVSRAWDKYIGVDRVTRGRNFYQALVNDGVKAQFGVVPGTRHEVNLAQLTQAEEFMQAYVPR